MHEEIALPGPWPLAEKLLFRFGLIFFILFIFFNSDDSSFTQALVSWEALHILHKPVHVLNNGSGDTTYHYLLLLLITLVSAMAMLAWSLLDRKAANYDKLYYWLLVILRFYVAMMMLNYGFDKIIQLQFPFPNATRLLDTYGNSSPMGLAWTFMGYSRGYNFFTGSAELICGLLLFFRRTTLLGAIIGIGVIANIVAINYCYDVPVKILSTMLLLMVIVILLKDLKRLSRFFFLNQQVEADNMLPHRFQKRWKNIALLSIKYLIISFLLISSGYGAFQDDRSNARDRPKPVLSGIFNTQTFILDKDTLPPLMTDSIRWRKAIIDIDHAYISIHLMNDGVRSYMISMDTIAKKITIGVPSNPNYKFHYTFSKDSVLTLNGAGTNDANIHITLKRFDERRFLLVRRGFHWINEMPFNR